MNTQQETIRCYEVRPEGVRAVVVPFEVYRGSPVLFRILLNARTTYRKLYRAQKPRVAPRMAIGVVVA